MTTADGIPVFCAFDEIVATESIIGNPRNPNTHPDKQLELLARIIDAQGWRAPITVSNRSGYVVRGHGRLAAARLLGKAEVPIDRQDYADEASEYADLIADNRIAELAEIDTVALKDLLQEIDTGELDMLLTGFDERDLMLMMTAVGGELIEDEAPEPPDDPVTKHGDLWLLGEHRVLCGDSTKAEDVARLMDGRKADCVFADPPYGVDYVAMRGKRRIANDATPDEALICMTDALRLMPADATFVCCSWRSLPVTIDAMVEVGAEPKACIVWDKERGVQNLDRYYKRHEFVLYAGPYGGQHTEDGDVWAIPRDFDPDHPTPKPVALPARAMNTATTEGQLVADPFGGSGSTLIAAEQTGRTCYTQELDPAYCDVIVQRWENLTGKKAVLDEHSES